LNLQAARETNARGIHAQEEQTVSDIPDTVFAAFNKVLTTVGRWILVFILLAVGGSLMAFAMTVLYFSFKLLMS
jgi:hypothetical protein